MKYLFIGFVIIMTMSCTKKVETINLNGNIYELQFSDYFEGDSLNEGKWTYRTDSKHWSTQLKENILVKDGELHIKLKKEKSLEKDYTGGGVISIDTFSYGYYECKMITPPGSGWHTSFWLMNHDGSGSTNVEEATIEIDIIENDSKDTAGYFVNFHRWKDKHIDTGNEYISAPGINKAYQIYACEYTPTYLKYYLNGVAVKTKDIEGMPHSGLNIWLTSIASHLGSTESVDDSYLPSEVKIDYVKYYKIKL